MISPSKFDGLQTKEDLKDLVSQLRAASLGRPIGVKIAAGHIEQDLEWIVYSGADFVTIDGRCGATGPAKNAQGCQFRTDHLCAVPRQKVPARAPVRYGFDHHGGLRVSSDFVKALAMGADAVAMLPPR